MPSYKYEVFGHSERHHSLKAVKMYNRQERTIQSGNPKRKILAAADVIYYWTSFQFVGAINSLQQEWISILIRGRGERTLMSYACKLGLFPWFRDQHSTFPATKNRKEATAHFYCVFTVYTSLFTACFAPNRVPNEKLTMWNEKQNANNSQPLWSNPSALQIPWHTHPFSSFHVR